ncbi:MAG: PIN domain-containing protein [Bryobacterales bacterium]|nr:PIN domain-containing protein [Bryobacterales bacterium]
MTKRYLPDVNVWFALALGDHPHHATAADWWTREIDVCRFLCVDATWPPTIAHHRDGHGRQAAHERGSLGGIRWLRSDSRVFLFPEATDIQPGFRKFSLRRSASPKIWADAYLAATAEAKAAVLVTFDGALATYGVGCTVLRPDRRGHERPGGGDGREKGEEEEDKGQEGEPAAEF